MEKEEVANLTVTSVTGTEDHYAHVFSDQPSLVLAAVCWSCVQFVGTPLLVGVVSYELGGTFHFQTVINKLSSYIYMLVTLYCLVGFNIFFLRFFTGPLPDLFCKVQALQKRGSGIAINLSLAEGIVLRYMYSCVWKNIGALNEEFFGTCFMVVNSILSMFFLLIIYLIGNFYDFHYALCMGQKLGTLLQDTTIILSHPDLTTVLAFFNYIILMAMCYWTHLKSIKAQPTQAYQPVQNQYTVENLFEVSKLFYFAMFILVVLGLLPYVLMRLLYGDDDVHLLPPLLTTASIFLPQADVFFLIPLAQYAKRPRLRAHARNLVGRLASRLVPRCIPIPAQEPEEAAAAAAAAAPSADSPVAADEENAATAGKREEAAAQENSSPSPSSPFPSRPPRPASAPPALMIPIPVLRSPPPTMVVEDIEFTAHF